MNTGSNRSHSQSRTNRLVLLWTFSWLTIASMAGRPVSAQGQGVAGRFPEPNQIATDFPDEAERYVVLNLLWDVLHEKAPAATAKRSVYYRAAETIRQKYMMMGGAAYTTLDERNRHLHADPNFRRAVLAKYHLENLPVEGAAPVRRTGDVTDAMIKGAFLKASPFMIASIVLMVWLARIGVREASTLSAVSPPPASVAGLPTLPESLRVVSLPYLKYSVEMESGLAIDKETALHTSVHTSTTGSAGEESRPPRPRFHRRQ